MAAYKSNPRYDKPDLLIEQHDEGWLVYRIVSPGTIIQDWSIEPQATEADALARALQSLKDRR